MGGIAHADHLRPITQHDQCIEQVFFYVAPVYMRAFSMVSGAPPATIVTS